MKINNKGFTLVELIAVIVIIAIIAAITTPRVIESFNQGKESSYDIMINNIVTSSKAYYEECQFGGLTHNGTSCSNEGTINLTLNDLVNTGFLTSTTETAKDETNTKKITHHNTKDPNTKEDIGSCSISITKAKEGQKYVYIVNSTTSDEKCPKGQLGRVN